jgi:hypothetical protein
VAPKCPQFSVALSATSVPCLIPCGQLLSLQVSETFALTALGVAAKMGHTDVVTMLIEALVNAKADVNHRTKKVTHITCTTILIL